MKPSADHCDESHRHSRRVALAGGLAGIGALAFASPLTHAHDATPVSGEGLKGRYVTIRTRVVAEGKSIEELSAQIESGLVPIIREIPGFITYYIVQNADTRERSAVSVFADKAGADASTAAASEFISSNNLSDYYEDATPVVMEGEIVIYADQGT